jgi:methionyl-tRNA synthetase
MPKIFYLTTAIDYTNGPPHIGHAYEKVLADAIARFHRLKGEKVYFLTGVDQHGQKVQRSAEKAGVSPQQFVDGLTARFITLWDKLEVKYDGWAATTDPRHKACVQGMLQRLYQEGQIYKDKQEGYYSIRQEQFLTDKERGPDGEFGPEWGEVEHRVEENYYFRLAPHKEWLLNYLRTHPDCVTPDFRQTELINAVEKLGGDLCISRPKSRLSWGIELPFDREYVNFVWFDALTNYISFIGYDPGKSYADQPDEFREKWPALHIIGKDILVPAHGIYWPIMLHALGFPDEGMPRFLVHGWWNISGAKMSKSLGNVIDPDALTEKYGAETLRYYLMSDMVIGQDADFLEYRIIERYNSDLANSLGNLLNRTLSMANRYVAGRLSKELSAADAKTVTETRRSVGYQVTDYRDLGDDVFMSGTMDMAIRIADQANLLIEQKSPWKMMKEGREQEVAEILYDLSERLRIIAILISPVLPKAAQGIFDQLNWKTDLRGKEERFALAEAVWGKLPDGHLVGKPSPLFPRIEASAD